METSVTSGEGKLLDVLYFEQRNCCRISEAGIPQQQRPALGRHVLSPPRRTTSQPQRFLIPVLVPPSWSGFTPHFSTTRSNAWSSLVSPKKSYLQLPVCDWSGVVPCPAWLFSSRPGQTWAPRDEPRGSGRLQRGPGDSTTLTLLPGLTKSTLLPGEILTLLFLAPTSKQMGNSGFEEETGFYWTFIIHTLLLLREWRRMQMLPILIPKSSDARIKMLVLKMYIAVQIEVMW